MQNKKGEQWTEEAVNTKLKEMIVSAYRKVASVSREKGVSLRAASYITAIDRILKAEAKRSKT